MIRKADKNDVELLAELAVNMWSGHTKGELADSFLQLTESKEACCFLKYENETPVGFAQCQLRYDYVEGTRTSPVGYLEGIYIEEEYRKKGYASELLAECEQWAKAMGCAEFASDCELDNTDSYEFHKALNFTVANKIICFTKALT